MTTTETTHFIASPDGRFTREIILSGNDATVITRKNGTRTGTSWVSREHGEKLHRLSLRTGWYTLDEYFDF